MLGMECFFDPTLESNSRELSLDGDELHHLHVLRVKKGDRFLVSNGRGLRALVRLISFDHAHAHCIVEHLEWMPGELPFRLTLAVGILLARDRFEWLVEKCTELGVARIIPIIGDYSQKGDILRIDRLYTKAVAALKQSQRSVLPSIEEPQRIEELLEATQDTVVVCVPDGRAPSVPRCDLTIVVGPEGGFSPRELECLAAGNIEAWSLGRLRLRSETAAIAATSIVGAAWRSYI